MLILLHGRCRYYGRYNYDYGFVSIIPPVGITTVRSKAVSVKDKLATSAGTVSSEATGAHQCLQAATILHALADAIKICSDVRAHVRILVAS
jgi:hypothetical protein